MEFASYELYQMKAEPETDDWLFQEFAVLTEKGYFPTVLDYKLVFASCLQPGTSPATLYKQLSSLAQRTHKFRCVNTGDVLVLRTGASIASYFWEHGEAIPFDGFFGRADGNAAPLTPETEHYVVPGKAGTWRVIDTKVIENRWFFLMESEKYGANARWMILDGNGKVIEDDNVSAFDETTVRRICASLKPAVRTPDHKTREPQPRRRLEVYEQYLENGEYLRASSPEVGVEQSYNMIDGNHNNRKTKPAQRRSVRARLREKQRQLHSAQQDRDRVLEKR